MNFPAIAVITTQPPIGLFVIGDLHRVGIPRQLGLAVPHRDVAQQNRLGKRPAVVESSAGLFDGEAAVPPAVLVILPIDFLKVGLRIDAKCADVR